jgi:hypothetical protein
VFVDHDRDISNDGVIGDALARAGVYTFRSPKSKSINVLLRKEHSKPSDSQGTRACARDLRRFFRLLGYIEQTPDGRWNVSPPAQSLLILSDQQEEKRLHEIWREALWNLQFEDGGDISHPYRILIRLVTERSPLPKSYSGLCLEARNDKETEFARILRIAGEPNPSATMNRLAGNYMAANSVKILPSLAEQLGDIKNDSGLLTISRQVSDILSDPAVGGARRARITSLLRQPALPRKRMPGTERRVSGKRRRLRWYDPDLVGQRYNAHEDCLDRLTSRLPDHSTIFQASYDLLVVMNARLLLVEAKTIRNDAEQQARAALAQLLYYEYFDVLPTFPNRKIFRLFLTDYEIPPRLCKFLREYNVGSVWFPEVGTANGDDQGRECLLAFGVKL